MDHYYSSPTDAEFPLELNSGGYNPTRNDRCEYPTTDSFDSLLEAGGMSLHGAGPGALSTLASSVRHQYPLDSHLGVHRKLVAIRRPAPPHRLSHGSYGIAPSASSALGGVYGYCVSQASEYRRSMQNPRPSRAGCSGVDCPTPAALPSVSDFFACNHTNCHPPSNVGLLSRRFPENQHWTRARALAVASLPYARRGIYSLPVEIIEMILDCFPAIDQLTSLGAGEAVLQTFGRHKAFLTLSATSKLLWKMFYVRSWITRVTPRTNNVRAMARLLSQVGAPSYTLFIERLIINPPRDSMGLLRDCLLGLPSLHTLGIVNSDGTIQPDEFKSISRYKLDFPNIKKVALPVFAYPILALLPNVEEVICFCGFGERETVTPILRKLRKPYVKERRGEIEPVLKSFTIVSPTVDWRCAGIIVDKFPRLRKLCLPEPSKFDMWSFRRLKEITELEILLTHKPDLNAPYDVDSIKSTAIRILQASECHKTCVCNHECGCAETNACSRCDPPKRFFRIKTCPGASYCLPGRVEMGGAYEESCVEEVQVSSKGVVLPSKRF